MVRISVFLLTFFGFLCFNYYSFAATIIGTDTTPAPTGNWINYTNPNSVNAIVKEGNYLWWGTSGGVVKWDTTNNSYRVYTTIDGLADNYVYSVAVNGSDKWFATYSGISKFDGTTWTTYNPISGGNAYYAIAIENSNIIWCGTSAGVLKFDGTTWTTYTTSNGLAANEVYAVVIDTSNVKWFVTATGGVSKFDGTTWTTYNTSNSGLVLNYLKSIAIDSTGVKWIGTYGYGVSKFDGTTWTTYNSTSNLPGVIINAIAVDNSNNKWVATGQGVAMTDNGSTWTIYKTADGLANDNVKTVFTDSAAKWFGTIDGLTKYDGSTWTTYKTVPNGPYGNTTYSIAIDGSNVKWFGNYGTITKFDSVTWSTYTISGGAVKTISIESPSAGGTKWFGVDMGGIYKFDGTNWTNYTPSNTSVLNWELLASAIDISNNKWFGTHYGVIKFDGTNWTKYTTTDGLVNDWVNTIAIDNLGTKWFGTYGAGVSKFDGTTWTTYTTANGLGSNSVYSIAIDNSGNKWFGGSYGVSRFDGTNWKNYIPPYGLAGYNVYSSTMDNSGNLWFGTLGGVSMTTDGSSWTTYTTANGLANRYVYAIAVDGSGNKWFATMGGVSKFSGTTGGITKHTISGYIKDGSSIPVSGTKVTFSGTIDTYVLADSSGCYQLVGLSSGTYTVTPSSTSYAFSPANRVFTNMTSGQLNQDFTAVPLYSVKGYIKDNNNNALGSVTLSLTGSATGSATSESNYGHFEFNYLSSTGTYTITPTKSGYAFTPTNRTYTNLSSDQTNQNFGVFTYSVSGYVKTHSSSPVSGIPVNLGNSSSTITNASGYYEFSNLVSNDYTISITSTNWTFSPTSRTYSTLSSTQTNQNFFGTYTPPVVIQPIISVTETSLNFGDVVIGQTKNLSFTITNNGNGTLTGNISDDKDWITLDKASISGNTTTVAVTVNTSGQQNGDYSGTISITSNGGNETVTVRVKATCVLVYPNPYPLSAGKLLTFWGSGVVPNNTEIKIYTLGMDLIKTIRETAGEEKLYWNGTNESGDKVVPGIYFYTSDSPKEKNYGRITVVK